MESNNKTVMVVDDEVDTVYIVRRLLENNNFNVLTAYDGDEAIKLIQNTEPDVMILDIMMPGATPKKIIEELKSLGRSTKVVYLSCLKESDKDAIEVRRRLLPENNLSFIAGYIEKPFDNKDLLGKIQGIVYPPN
jgi:two-component system response regulator VicR